jgi:hypothetical protein
MHGAVRGHERTIVGMAEPHVVLRRRLPIRVFRVFFLLFCFLACVAVAASPMATTGTHFGAGLFIGYIVILGIVTFRPRVVVMPTRVELRNSLKTTTFQWSDVVSITPISGGFGKAEMGLGSYVGFILTSGERIRARAQLCGLAGYLKTS